VSALGEAVPSNSVCRCTPHTNCAIISDADTLPTPKVSNDGKQILPSSLVIDGTTARDQIPLVRAEWQQGAACEGTGRGDVDVPGVAVDGYFFRCPMLE